MTGERGQIQVEQSFACQQVQRVMSQRFRDRKKGLCQEQGGAKGETQGKMWSRRMVVVISSGDGLWWPVPASFHLICLLAGTTLMDGFCCHSEDEGRQREDVFQSLPLWG